MAKRRSLVAVFVGMKSFVAVVPFRCAPAGPVWRGRGFRWQTLPEPRAVCSVLLFCFLHSRCTVSSEAAGALCSTCCDSFLFTPFTHAAPRGSVLNVGRGGAGGEVTGRGAAVLLTGDVSDPR